MRIVKFLLVTWLAALVWAVAAAPAPRAGGGTHNPRPAPTSCPTITVSCPETAAPHQPFAFTANISGGDAAMTPTYKWKVPGLTITSGEDTGQIIVGPPARGGKVEATVEIGGYDMWPCPMTASCTTTVIADPLPRKIDEYGNVAVGDEKLRLDDLTDELRNDPAAQGYLLCYGGRRSRLDEARRRCDRARNFLVISRGIDAPRIVAVDAGYREKPTVELWLVPADSISLPVAGPTVDPRDVRPPTRPGRPRRR